MPNTPEDVVKEARAMLTQASRIHALSDSDPSKDVDVGWMLATLCDEVERLRANRVTHFKCVTCHCGRETWHRKGERG